MSADVSELLVFIASPSDLPEEREAVRRAAEDVNTNVASRFGARLQVVGWEYVQPELGRPQELINPLIDQCDIFVGLLKRRWGSATGAYSSGFEEEFQRAKARRTSGELPAIGMFFGRIPDDSLADPGPELAKVLTFKRQLQDEHAALYRQFDGIQDLQRQLTSFFSSIIAGVVQRSLQQVPQGVTSTASLAIPDPEESIDSSLRQVGDTLLAFADMVLHQEAGESLDADRLLLFSLAIHRDEQLLPAHTANRLYRKADHLSLTYPEYQLWLRTLAEDIGRADSTGWSRVVPGWRIATKSWWKDTRDLGEQITKLAEDQDRSVTRGAFIILRQLNERPSSLWNYPNKRSIPEESRQDSPTVDDSIVGRWLKVFGGNGAPESTFAYIAAVANGGDLPLLDTLISRLEGAPSSIELTALRDYVAGNPNTLANLVAQRYSVPSWEEEAVLAVVDGLDQNALEQLIIGQHHSDCVRRAALEVGARDGRLTAAALQKALSTDDSALHDVIFRHFSKLGAEALREIISRLEDVSLKDELNTRLLAITVSADELREIMGQPLRGVEAWVALALKEDTTFADLAREIFDNDASALNATLPDLADSERREKLKDFLSARSRQAALRLLMHLPASHKSEEDTIRARAELQRNHWLTRFTAAEALAALGAAEDAPNIVEVARNAYPEKRQFALLAAAINLGGRGLAGHLAASEDIHLAKLAAEALAQEQVTEESELTELLYSPHAPVRIVALTGLRGRLDTDQLVKLLEDYPKRKKGYYYNVVAELDRLVYAPERAAEAPIIVPLA